MVHAQSYIVGVDEVGRGPLAGPVMVGVVIVPQLFDWSLLPGVGDSKQVSAKKRVLLYETADHLREEGRLDYEVAAMPASYIDRYGIVPAIQEALVTALTIVTQRSGMSTDATEVFLDGGLQAPAEYLRQQTVIKGDRLIPVIGLASIIAKVTRDREMEVLGEDPRFAPYGFQKHKGYGTRAHQEAIRTHGLSSLHRASFCRNITTMIGDN